MSGEICEGPLIGLAATDTGGSRKTVMPDFLVGLRSWARQPAACPLRPVVYLWGSGGEVGGEGGEVRGVGGEDAVVEAEGEGHDVGVDDV